MGTTRALLGVRRKKSLDALSDAELVAIIKASRADWEDARSVLMHRHCGIARKAGSKFRRVPWDEVDFITVEVIAASIRKWEGKGEFADYVFRGVCNRIKNHLARTLEPIREYEIQVRGEEGDESVLAGGLDRMGARYGGSVTASNALQAPADTGITLTALEAVVAALPEADRRVVAARLAADKRLGYEAVAKATGLPLAQVVSSSKHLQQVVVRKLPEYAGR